MKKAVAGTIKATDIYGFPKPGEKPVLKDHPMFPNPRIKMDKDLIGEMKGCGKHVEPIILYKHEDGMIPLHGKTRLTAVAEFYNEFPDDTSDYTQAIPYVLEEGPTDEIFVRMATLQDARRPLTKYELAAHLVFLMQERQVSRDMVLMILAKQGKSQKAANQFLNDALEIINKGTPKVKEALAEQDIETTTAKQIVKTSKTPEEQDAKVQQIRALKSSGVSETKAKQNIGIKKANASTLSTPEIEEFLAEICADVVTALESGVERDSVDWTDEDKRNEFLDNLVSVVQWQICAEVIKINTLSLREQIEYIKGKMGAAQLDCMPDYLPDSDPEDWASSNISVDYLAMID